MRACGLDKERLHAGLRQEGFSLIELMITLVIAMVILGGLLLTFIKQNEVYRYQNARVDTVQDVEFVINYIADDLRASLHSPVGSTAANATRPVENANFAGTGNTTSLTFDVWVDPNMPGYAGVYSAVDAISRRAQRKYLLVQSDGSSCFSPNPIYQGKDFCLRYDREASTDNTNSASSEMIRGVTMFKVFRDDASASNAARASFVGIPPELPTLKAGGFGTGRTLIDTFTVGASTVQVQDSDATEDVVPGYTILLEVAVDASYKHGSFVNALGQDVRAFETPPRKRVIRYVQLHPFSAVP